MVYCGPSPPPSLKMLVLVDLLCQSIDKVFIVHLMDYHKATTIDTLLILVVFMKMRYSLQIQQQHDTLYFLLLFIFSNTYRFCFIFISKYVYLVSFIIIWYIIITNWIIYHVLIVVMYLQSLIFLCM